MEIEFDQTPEDLVALRRWYRLRMPERRWQRRVNRMGMFAPAAFVVAGFALMLWEGRVAVARWDFIRAGGFIAAFGAFLTFALIFPALGFWGLAESGMRWFVLREIRKGRVDQSFFQRKRLAFDEESVCHSGDDFEITLSWSRIPNIVMDSDHLFVFTIYTVSRVEAFIVPREAFGRDDRFLAFCKQAISCWKRHS